MVHSGKIYETDGATAVAVHLPDAIRPLAPVNRAPSLRYVRSLSIESETELPDYIYGNPSSIIGPSQEVEIPSHVAIAGIDAYIAVIAVSDAHLVPADQADDHILGLSLMLSVVSRDLERNGSSGRAWDIANALGPVVTTPEELDDFVVSEEQGRHYRLEAVVRVNGVERERSNTEEMVVTGALALSSASYSSPVRVGDVFALGPIVRVSEVSAGDEIQFAVENLGTLSLRIAD